jgi:hypothetical protein
MTRKKLAPLDVGSIGGGPGCPKSGQPLAIPNLADDLARVQAESTACIAEEAWQSQIMLAGRLGAQGGRPVLIGGRKHFDEDELDAYDAASRMEAA